MNWTILMINPNDCMNITYAENIITDTAIANNTWTEIRSSIVTDLNFSVFLRVNLNCGAASWIFQPEFYYRGCRVGANFCDDDVENVQYAG